MDSTRHSMRINARRTSPPQSDGDDDRMSSPDTDSFMQSYRYGTCACGLPSSDKKYQMCRECVGQFWDDFAAELLHSTEALNLTEIKTHLDNCREDVQAISGEMNKFWTPTRLPRTEDRRDWKEVIDTEYLDAFLRLPRVDYAGFKTENPNEHPVVGYFFQNGAILVDEDGLPTALPRRQVEMRAEMYSNIEVG